MTYGFTTDFIGYGYRGRKEGTAKEGTQAGKQREEQMAEREAVRKAGIPRGFDNTRYFKKKMNRRIVQTRREGKGDQCCRRREREGKGRRRKGKERVRG